MSNSLLAAYLERHPELRSAPQSFLKSGEDVTAALAVSSRSVIVLEDGVYAPPVYRENAPKLLIARNPGAVRFAISGDILSASQWVRQGDRWTTQLVNSRVHRLVRTDRVDGEGFPERVRDWQVTGSQLSVAIDDPKVLQGYYFDESGNSRVLVRHGALMCHGIDFDGVAGFVLNEAGSAPEFWVARFQSRFSPENGFVIDLGGAIYLENGQIHAARRDGWNTEFGGGKGLVFAAGVRLTGNGDGGDPAFEANQGGSSHSGFAVVVGCLARGNLVQQFADTSVPGKPNASWYVGNIVRGEGIGIQIVGPRTVFLDTNELAGFRHPLVVDPDSQAFSFNNNIPLGLTTPYDPQTAP